MDFHAFGNKIFRQKDWQHWLDQMGNCLRWKPPMAGVAEKSLNVQVPDQPTEESPMRFGKLGLSDCGFEYRQVTDRVEDEPELFETRLFHKTTGVMITAKNRKAFIPDGPIFERVMTCCQQITQEKLVNEYGLEWIHLFEYGGEAMYALASPNYATDPNEKRPFLMIFTGKGNSRAGILSVRELLESGLERGSAIYHIHQAIRRQWSVIVLDPNARGRTEGLLLTRRSLDHLDWNAPLFTKHPVYILSHSAAGGYIVQYLLEGDHRHKLLSSIKGLVFTDSTHNIQWAKDDTDVAEFLESQQALYIRNCSENPSDTFANHKNKKAGEEHEGNRWWHRRFGRIPTVWAGTTDHSSMCWEARNVIWQFFDQRLEQDSSSCTVPSTTVVTEV